MTHCLSRVGVHTASQLNHRSESPKTVPRRRTIFIAPGERPWSSECFAPVQLHGAERSILRENVLPFLHGFHFLTVRIEQNWTWLSKDPRGRVLNPLGTCPRAAYLGHVAELFSASWEFPTEFFLHRISEGQQQFAISSIVMEVLPSSYPHPHLLPVLDLSHSGRGRGQLSLHLSPFYSCMAVLTPLLSEVCFQYSAGLFWRT